MQESTFPTSVRGMKLVCASLTDIGCRRETNQDAVGFFEGGEKTGTYLMVIADGVGGAYAGDVASQLAVKTVGEVFFKNGSPTDLREAMQEAFIAANEAIISDADRDIRHASMATTCTAVAIRGEELVVGHVGDTRAYLVRDGRIEQLTHDHSQDSGHRRQDQGLPAGKRPHSNMLTRWLGMPTRLEVELNEGPRFTAGTTLVLCSDGLIKVTKDEEILYTAAMFLPGRACERLISLARERGGPDNITVQVAALTPA